MEMPAAAPGMVPNWSGSAVPAVAGETDRMEARASGVAAQAAPEAALDG